MKNNKKLYPNCSEIVWRLNGLEHPITKRIDFETDTSSIDDLGEMENMLTLLSGEKKNNLDKIGIEQIDNVGGGGDFDYMERVFNLAVKIKKGEITKKKALKELGVEDE